MEEVLQRLLTELKPSPLNVTAWVKIFATINHALLSEKQGKEYVDENGWDSYHRFFNDLDGLKHENKDDVEFRSDEIKFVMDSIEELQLNSTRTISTLMPLLAWYSGTISL